MVMGFLTCILYDQLCFLSTTKTSCASERAACFSIVHPLKHLSSKSAPLAMRSSRISALLWRAAKMAGVLPKDLWFTSAPKSIRRFTVSISPVTIALQKELISMPVGFAISTPGVDSILLAANELVATTSVAMAKVRTVFIMMNDLCPSFDRLIDEKILLKMSSYFKDVIRTLFVSIKTVN